MVVEIVVMMVVTEIILNSIGWLIVGRLGFSINMMNRIYLFYEETFELNLELPYHSLQTYDPVFFVLNIIRQLRLS